MKEYRVAIVGATGMVGQTFLKVLEEMQLPVREYVLFASAKSAGKEVEFLNKTHIVQELTQTSFESGFDFALFSAGGATSTKYAPIAAAAGCVVIDNSSAFRMQKNVPLIVPEVNGTAAGGHGGIISNPNCSTIQAVVALAPLHKAFKIKRIVFSTYQAVSGAGQAGWNDLHNAMAAYPAQNSQPLQKFPYPILNNCLPHIDSFLNNGYTKEEMKMVNETRKILEDETIAITATTVRVPVLNSHSESINVEFERQFELAEVLEILKSAPGITVVDDIENSLYPLAANASGSNMVFVGRLRRDDSIEKGLNMWVVADNIRKGAATNAVQIAKYMIENELL